MKKKWIALIGMALIFMTSCVKETIYVEDTLITDADVFYEYTADNFGTIIEGDIFNDGETYINAVQLEVRLYDRRGILIDNEYLWVDTYFNPGGQVSFYFDLPYSNVYDVDIRINRYD
ncbi:MAG: hypothetical protein COA58_05770 [Bacteroidetes bacterium]|nr:MAG: hypothetical protein COA58_05770 [Bacteroidota bacterium]